MPDSTAGSNDFHELMRKVRDGDRTAMSQLVERYEPDIRIIARARLGKSLRPYMDSVDIVQSVHRSLLVGLRDDRFEFASPEKLIALAATMVRRKVARHWRKMRRQNRNSGAAMPDSDLPDYVVSVADSIASPAEQVSYREQVTSALNRMEGVDRDLIALRLEGYSTAKAAELLEINPDVARVRLSRLRRRLKDANLLSDLI